MSRTRRFDVRFILACALLLGLLLAAAAAAAPTATVAVIDYDFSERTRGEFLTSYTKNGVTMLISTTNLDEDAPKTATILDSANPGPNNNFGDPDLGSPNEDCDPPGPGISDTSPNAAGPGQPGANCNPVGNVLIIAENTTDDLDNSTITCNDTSCSGVGPPDGLIDFPDDDADGGVITLTFELESAPGTPIDVGVNFFELLDIEPQEAADNLFVGFYSDATCDTAIDIQEASGFGDNTFEQFEFQLTGVQCVKILFPASGAIPRIVVTTEQELAGLGDYVWLDSNQNGVQDDGADSGVNGVTVNLLDENGQVIDTTVTADDSLGRPGFYFFGDLVPGTYQVQFIEPDTGYNGFTTQDAAVGDPAENNDSQDSDADTATGLSPQVTLAAGEINPTLDAGLLPGPSSVALLGTTAAAADRPLGPALLTLGLLALTVLAFSARRRAPQA